MELKVWKKIFFFYVREECFGTRFLDTPFLYVFYTFCYVRTGTFFF